MTPGEADDEAFASCGPCCFSVDKRKYPHLARWKKCMDRVNAKKVV